MKRILLVAFCLMAFCGSAQMALNGPGYWCTLSAGGAPPYPSFHPTNLSNLKLWLDATTLTNQYANHTQITNWADLSGNGNSAGTGATPNGPIYVADGINSKPAVAFVGGTSCSYLVISNVVSSRPLTVFVVLSPTNNPGTGAKVFLGRFQSYCAYVDLHSTTTITIFDNSATSTTVDGTYRYNVPFCLSWTHAATGAPSVYTNGVTVPLADTSSYSSSVGLDGSGIYPNFVGTFYLPCNCAYNSMLSEIIVYGGVKNDYDRGWVEHYLINKWGLN